jgi:hypothetical protein
MDIFNFDFDNGNNGSLAVSNQWWIYLIVTLPLTVGTFIIFHIMERKQRIDDNNDAGDSETNRKKIRLTADSSEPSLVEITD